MSFSIQIQSDQTIQSQINILQQNFQKQPYLSYKQRYNIIKNFYNQYLIHKKQIFQAIKDDIGKPFEQSLVTEISQIDHEFKYFLSNLKSLMKPQKCDKNMANMFYKKLQIQPVPYGVTLLIVPFNYPANLSLIPLIGLLASGNYVAVKYSRTTPQLQQIVSQIITKSGIMDYVQIIQNVKQFNLDDYKDFNLIVFTGSTQVGKLIQEKASKSLTKCILECGGSNPYVIDENLSNKQMIKAVNDLIELKVTNAGQTCVSCNYICLIGEKTFQQLKEIVKQKFEIINKQWEKMMPVINQSKINDIKQLLQKHKVLFQFGGQEEKLLSNFYFLEADYNDEDVLQEQFCPVVFVLKFNEFQQWINWYKQKYINNTKPLASYLQSQNKQHIQQFIQQIDAGSNIINSGLTFMGSSLPFGGVGTSGQGQYHGKQSFIEFSHMKPIAQGKQGLIDNFVGNISRFPYKIQISEKLLGMSLHNYNCQYFWYIIVLLIVIIYAIVISILYFKE